MGRSVPEILAVAEKMDALVLSPLLGAAARLVPNLRYFYITGSQVDVDASDSMGVAHGSLEGDNLKVAVPVTERPAFYRLRK